MRYDYTRAERVIRFIETYCKVPDGAWVGQPIRLRDFQKNFIRKVYRTVGGKRVVRRAVLSMGRKNGKTALISALTLAHLVGPEARRNVQIFSTAQSREQSSLVYKLFSKMARQNPHLLSNLWLKEHTKEALAIASGTTYGALGHNPTVAHGLSPMVSVHDELGQADETSLLYDTLESGMGAHEEPLSFIMSTQASNDTALLSTIIDDLKANHDDERYVLELYEADPDCDINDRAQWAKANPALGDFRSLPDLVEQAERAVRMPSTVPVFRNLVLNQRVNTVQVFLSSAIWDMNNAPVDVDGLRGMPVYAAIDLSSRTDLTALVAIVPHDGGTFSVLPFFWMPENGLAEREVRDRLPYRAWVQQGFIKLCPGASIDLRWVVAELAELNQRYDVRVLGFDRWRVEWLQNAMNTEGLVMKMEGVNQGYKDMAPALDLFESLAVDAKLRHGGNPVLRHAMANARVAVDPAGNRKLDKSKSAARIDGAVALAMAIAVSAKEQQLGTPSLLFV